MGLVKITSSAQQLTWLPPEMVIEMNEWKQTHNANEENELVDRFVSQKIVKLIDM